MRCDPPCAACKSAHEAQFVDLHYAVANARPEPQPDPDGYITWDGKSENAMDSTDREDDVA